MASEPKKKNARSDRLLNEVGQAIWLELAKEYGPRSLKRIASAAIVAFEKLPHDGKMKALAIVNGDKNVELAIEVIPDEAELQRLEFRTRQIKARIKREISQESRTRKKRKTMEQSKSA